MKREALIEKVALINEHVCEDDLLNKYLDELSFLFPNTFNSDLIFWPIREMTIEEIADEVLYRESILESGGVSALCRYYEAEAKRTLADSNSPVWAQAGALGLLEFALKLCE